MTEKSKTETETPKKKRTGRPPTGTVSQTYRLPVWIADANAGGWERMREVLDEWVANGAPELDPMLPEECKTVTMRVDQDVVAKLEAEAKRLSKVTNRKRTAGWVARRLFEDQYEPG